MTTDTPAPPPDLRILWTRLAFFASVVGVVGSLYLSLQMDLKACPLCFYQRAFIMSVAAVLGFGLFLPGVPTAALTPLALGPAVAGGGIAAWHVYLDVTGAMECPFGVTGLLPAPQESLIVYAILLALLLVDLFHQGRYVMQGCGAFLLGGVLCITSIKGVHPTLTLPTPAPLDGCRKVVKEK
jgi:hypothetical protein